MAFELTEFVHLGSPLRILGASADACAKQNRQYRAREQYHHPVHTELPSSYAYRRRKGLFNATMMAERLGLRKRGCLLTSPARKAPYLHRSSLSRSRKPTLVTMGSTTSR
ncbi:hypothetical protein MESS4_430113 [Mesorhizobium sp. STM 4661]|nr:hypothetical protein MESS4_430113 [Mesorhizobium sp. STM 4661]